MNLWWLALINNGRPASNQGEAAVVAVEPRSESAVMVEFQATVRATGPSTHCAFGVGDCVLGVVPVIGPNLQPGNSVMIKQSQLFTFCGRWKEESSHAE